MLKRFEPVMVNEQEIGQSYHHDSSFIFFGNRHATLENLKSKFSNLSLRQMRQVHGNKLAPIDIAASVISDSDDRPEADALWTGAENMAPVVSTADCLPVLISGHNFVCSIHAGWKGVLNQIIVSTLEALPIKENQRISAFIGPHILKETFEFDVEPAQQFATLAMQLQIRDIDSIVTVKPLVENKVTVDLARLAEAQIHKVCPWAEIVKLPINTYVDNSFCSFRRDRVVGRNLSFVARLKG